MYFLAKEKISKEIKKYIKEICSYDVRININPQDDSRNFYLTVLGSVADTGDVGVVGRGNRINGLITPMRPMSIEAPSGKNPIDHTGKLYGILTHKLANDLAILMGTSVEVNLFTAKNTPLNKPDEISVELSRIIEINKTQKKEIIELIRKRLNNMEEITKSLIFEGEILW